MMLPILMLMTLLQHMTEQNMTGWLQWPKVLRLNMYAAFYLYYIMYFLLIVLRVHVIIEVVCNFIKAFCAL